MTEGLFSYIKMTISKHVFGLETTLAYYTHFQQLLDPTTKLYQIMVGVLKYIGNVQNMVTSYYFEENYQRIFTKRRENNLTKIEKSKKNSNYVLAGCLSLSLPTKFVIDVSISESWFSYSSTPDESHNSEIKGSVDTQHEEEDEEVIVVKMAPFGLNDIVVQPTEIKNKNKMKLSF